MNPIALAQTHSKIARRQKALWFVAVPLTAFAVLLSVISPASPQSGGVESLAFTGRIIAIFTGIAYAAAFSDFFVSPTRLGVHELEAAAPVNPAVLRFARILGAFTVIFTPSLLILLVIGFVQTLDGRPYALLDSVAVSVTIVAPAALISMSLSGLAGAALPRSLARIVAILIWFWLVFSTPMIPLPTPNGTILGITGDTIAAGYFGASPIYPPAGPLGLKPSLLTATLSLLWQIILIVTLLVIGSTLAEKSRKR